MMTSSAPPGRKVSFLDLRPAYAELRDEIDAAIARVTSSGWYLLGGELEAFEHEFSRYVGADHCVGMGNGLDALTLVLRAWGIGPGDEVIVPSNTYIATWLAISAVGALPVPVEPDPFTYAIDADSVERAITGATRAVVPVHLYGMATDVEAIRERCSVRGIRVLEDAAQAHGASVRGKRAGALADAAAWSFYPTKNLGAFGDAGAVTTNDSGLADSLRVMRNYGSRVKYVNEVRGVNSRLDEIQAAVLRVKLRHLDDWNARRARVASLYATLLSNTSLTLPVTPPERKSVWHIYPVRLSDREMVRSALADAGVETLIHYPIPPHKQQAYADQRLSGRDFPISEAIHREVLSLPIGPHLAVADARYAAESLKAILKTE